MILIYQMIYKGNLNHAFLDSNFINQFKVYLRYEERKKQKKYEMEELLRKAKETQ